MGKIRLLGLAAVGLAAVCGTAASAMPVMALPSASGETGAIVENVAWVCGPYGCHHVYRRPPPRFYGGPAYYAPRPYRGWGGYYGGHRSWHHGWNQW